MEQWNPNSSESKIKTAMRKSPVTVQQWVDTLPTASETPATPTSSLYGQQLRNNRKYITRDMSFQSDDGSSHCSSVESVLELRRPDPEAVLLGLGFGPRRNSSSIGRIPARFLQPSKLLTHIDIDKFLESYYDPLPDQNSSPGSPARIKPKTY